MRILLVTALLLPGIAIAADAPGTATWTWNAKESTMPAGMPMPKSQVLKITKDDGKTFAWTMTTVGADGKTQKLSWSGAYDGKERPVKGGGSASFTKTGDVMNISWKEKDGTVGTESCTTSSDKKKMTCKGSMKMKDGKTAEFTDVMDRS
jgi:hypothetical protein